MATKNKQNAENNKPTGETWRKPLQVPPRTNAMRSFYQGGVEEEPNQAVKQANRATTLPNKNTQPAKMEQKSSTQTSPKKAGREVKAELRTEQTAPQNNESASESNTKQANILTEKDLSRHLGFDIDDLFDVNELLRGKSFDIYQTLIKCCDEKGRCKITQPELMKRTGIKNRRTFYKHEERLINLKLLEKRHLPGDHKGIVYRVFEISDVLPVPNEILEQFKKRLENFE